LSGRGSGSVTSNAAPNRPSFLSKAAIKSSIGQLDGSITVWAIGPTRLDEITSSKVDKQGIWRQERYTSASPSRHLIKQRYGHTQLLGVQEVGGILGIRQTSHQDIRLLEEIFE
jgi:hypothetical protein